MRNNLSLPRQSARTFRIILQSGACLGILGIGLFAQNQPALLSAANPKPALGGQASLSTPTATLRATSSPTHSADLPKIGTPTPGTKPQANTSQSPIASSRAPGALPVDGNTLALYHFDTQIGNTTPDETGNFTGTMVNNVSIVSGLFNNAIKGDGRYGPGSYARAGSIGALSQGTIEAYVDFAAGACQGQDSFTIISIGGDFGSGVEGARLIDDINGRLNFEILAADGWHVASSGINVCRYLLTGSAPVWPYETWRFHHVAGTWGPRGMEIWVDGVLHGITDPGYPNNFFFNNGYNCNPQLQIGSYPYPPYPDCPQPRLGVSPVDYRGIYTGGIPANTNIVIGCDPVQFNPPDQNGVVTNTCFGGRLDDVRISNIQRTFTVDIDPPDRPPDKISQEYARDGYTVALYHMNSLTPWGYVPDTVGLHDGLLRGGAALMPDGRYNGSLSVFGNYPYVDTLSGDVLRANTLYGTVEAWIKPYVTSAPFSVLTIGSVPIVNSQYLSLGMQSSNGTLSFGVYDNTTMQWADSGITVSSLAGCWHHVAGTWGQRGVEIWVDGVKRGMYRYYGQLYAASGDFLMGCNGYGQCMNGYIDEVRVSSVQRTFLTPDVLAPVRLRAPGAPSTGGFSIFLPFVNTINVIAPPVCPWG